MELTIEKSTEIASSIKTIAEIIRTLDIDYLKESIRQMKKNHSLRDSAMILSPNPHTVIEQQELNAEKINGLELLLKLAINQRAILEKEVALVKAMRNSKKISDLFGI